MGKSKLWGVQDLSKIITLTLLYGACVRACARARAQIRACARAHALIHPRACACARDFFHDDACGLILILILILHPGLYFIYCFQLFILICLLCTPTLSQTVYTQLLVFYHFINHDLLYINILLLLYLTLFYQLNL